MKHISLVSLFLCLLFAPPLFAKEKKRELTIVPKEDAISDDAARFELAKILAYERKTAAEALFHLARLKQTHSDLTVRFLEGRAYASLAKHREAGAIFSELEKIPNLSFELLRDLAFGEFFLGHYGTAKCLFQRARVESPKKEIASFDLEYALTELAWGDTLEAQELLDALKEQKNEIPQKKLSLAQIKILIAEERLNDAEQLLRGLLAEGFDPELAAMLLEIRLRKKEFCLVEAWLSQFSKEQGNLLPLMRTFASLQYQEKEYLEAAYFYKKIAQLEKNDQARYEALKWAAASLDRSGVAPTPALLEEIEVLYPEGAAAQFFSRGELDRNALAFIQNVEEIENPQILNEWAELYQAFDNPYFALRLQRKAVQLDPDYTPSMMALALLYPSLFDYAKGLCIVKKLVEEFGSFKFLLQEARALSWQKSYSQSVANYDALSALFPDNSLLVLEKARVLMWANRGDQALSVYQELFNPWVDEILVQELDITSEPDPCGFEYFEKLSDEASIDWDRSPFLKKSCLERFLLNHFALWRTQKDAYLEYLAKKAKWENRPLHALRYQENVLAEAPGNEEILFDHAEVYYSLGLWREANLNYGEINFIDPYHPLALVALNRNQILMKPAAFCSYEFWREFGRIELSAILVHKASLGISKRMIDNSYHRFSTDCYFEHGLLNHRTYPAAGFTYVFGKQLSEALTFEAKVIGKAYQSHIRSNIFGHLFLKYNFCDVAYVDLLFERRSQLYNQISIEQGIFSDSLSLHCLVPLRRDVLLEGRYTWLAYSDHNYLNWANLRTSFLLVEHPHEFWLRFEGEYRNTAFLDIPIYQGSTLVTIIHPYWCPKRYYMGCASLEYTYDFSPLDFGESEKRYVRAILRGGSDTEQNPFIALTLGGHIDFCDRWRYSLEGLVHHAPMWNAQGVWTTLEYFF